MLHLDTQSRSKASASQSRFRSAASYDILGVIRRSKNLSAPSNRTRNWLLSELNKQYPFGLAHLFHPTELEKFETAVSAHDMVLARSITTGTLSAFQAEMTAFSESLFNTFATKGDDYKRIMAAWHLYTVLIPLARDGYSDPNCLTAAEKRDLFWLSAASFNYEKEPKSSTDYKPNNTAELKRNFKIQDSFEALHKLLTPLICTICHARVTVWTFLEHTNVCYEYEMGKRTLLSVNKDLLKLCEESQTEALKVNVRLLPEAELELENEVFGRSRADKMISTYKESYISDKSNKSGKMSPEKKGRKDTFLGDHFEFQRLGSGKDARPSEGNAKDVDRKGPAWGLPPRNPNYLRAMAHANEMRLGLNKLSSDLSKDKSSRNNSHDSRGDLPWNSSGGSESRQSVDKKERKSTLGGSDLVRLPSNSNVTKNAPADAEDDLLGDAFFGNDDGSASARTSGKNSQEPSQNDNQSVSRHSNDKSEVEVKHTDFRPAQSPKRFRESHYPILGVIDEEDENLVSKRQISPVILYQEKKTHLTPEWSEKPWVKRVMNKSPLRSPEMTPKSPSYQDAMDDYKQGRDQSKVLGSGLDSSDRFLPQPTAFASQKNNALVSDSLNTRPSHDNSGALLPGRNSDQNHSLTALLDKDHASDSTMRKKSPKLEEGPKSPRFPAERLPSIGSDRPKDESLSPGRRTSSQSSFKKNFGGFHQPPTGVTGMYFQPKTASEGHQELTDEHTNSDGRNVAASRSPIRRVSMNTSTMYNKPKEQSDTFGIWTNPNHSDQLDFTPKDIDSPSPPKSTNLGAYDRPIDIKITKSGPSVLANPFSFRNSLSSMNNKEGSSRHTNPSLQKSAFAESTHSQKTAPRFPTCRTEYMKPVRLQEPKPVERKEIPFEVRRNIWIQASKAATEYRKPQSKKAANQDHLVYVLNKRIQQYRTCLLSISSMINYKAEKDLIFELGLIKDRFQKETVRDLITRFMDSLKKRIDLIEQQHKKQSMIGELERNFQARRIFRNKISVSYSNLHTLAQKPKRKPKALTALNFEIVGGKLSQKKAGKDAPPAMFLQKLIKMEESSRNVPSARKKSADHEDQKSFAHLESMSDVDANQKNKLALDTSIGDGLSALSSASKDDNLVDEFEDGPPADLILHKKQLPETTRVPSQPHERPSIERMASGKTQRRLLKKHPSDSKILEIAEREKLYYEHTKEVCLDNFEFLKEIGKGAYGKVYLATHKPTREIYALKIIQFQEEVSKKFLDEMQNEISILNVIDGEFLAKALFSFVDRHCLCIAMEYLVGGDFRNILESECRLELRSSQYYLAQLCLAVEELHSRNIVHRDLKPENILLDKNLKLKLADFGLSEFRKRAEINVQVNNNDLIDPRHKKQTPQEEKKKLVGTPDYIPPEVLMEADLVSERQLEETSGSNDGNKRSPSPRLVGIPENVFDTHVDSCLGVKMVSDEKGGKESAGRKITQPDAQLDEYSSAIDWWGVGCLLYEFLVGVSPFGATTLDEVWRNIRNFNIIWPEIGYGEDCVTPEAQDLILRFLDKDPLKRIGVKNFQDIQNHPFFKGLDWSTLATSPAPLSLDIKLPSTSRNIKMSIVAPRKLPSMPTHRFDAQDLVISRIDLFYELNIKRVLDVRETHSKLLANHLQLLDKKPVTLIDIKDLPVIRSDLDSPDI